ncbi:MAG TPA: response regulator transcription factor [Chitinophagaceae bacterium]|nr:response regulator transcription factor [Chitinophagaceae bacterium]HNU12984.1 response regulator transcription factor [Chitinophagaceae bacterium]
MIEVRVLIVEDEPLIAEDIATALINNDFTVSAIVYSKDDALAELKNNPPDLVVLDINLNGGEEGIEIAKVINEKYFLPFVYLTSYSDKLTLIHAKNTEPAGYIVKPFSDAGLFAAMEIAVYNHAQKSKLRFPELNDDVINRHLPSPLSEREFGVVQLIYNGKTNNQIAEDLFISINTVKAHIKNIHQKLDADSRSTLIARLRKLMTN